MKKEAFFYFIPFLCFSSIFIFFPGVKGLLLSFYDLDPFTLTKVFVGFDNFNELFKNPDYLFTLQVQLQFTLLTVVPGVAISLLIALLLDCEPSLHKLFRTLFLMPVVISSAMAAMLWIFIFNPTAGILSYVLNLVGVTSPNLLSDPKWALVSVALVTLWKEIGFNILFLLAGLASIPSELKEAATLDGAGFFKRSWYITIPLLSPTLFFVVIVSVLSSFQGFGPIHILTGGGPAGASTTLVYSLYRDAFVHFRLGLAGAEGMVLFVLMCLVTLAQMHFAKRRIHYG